MKAPFLLQKFPYKLRRNQYIYNEKASVNFTCKKENKYHENDPDHRG